MRDCLKTILCVFSITVSFAAMSPTQAQDDPEPGEASSEQDREWFGHPQSKPFLQWQGVTGDWGGLRTNLEQWGLTIGGEYVVEYSAVDGGANSGDSARNILTIDFEVDMEQAFGIKGGRLFAQYLSVNAERGGSADTGDIQMFSNIENPRSLDVIYELWYEQLLLDDRLRIKIGKVDANTEFNYIDAAKDFAHSSAGFSPTIFVFPTYPDPATSVNIFVKLFDSDNLDFTAGYGFYDGALGVDGIPTGRRGPSTFFSDEKSNDFMHIAEGILTWEGFAGLLDGRFAFGGWWHSGDFVRLDGAVTTGTEGFYVTYEQRLIDSGGFEDLEGAAGPRGEGGPEDDRGLYIFAQFGSADDEISEFEYHFAGGFLWRGMCEHRPNDAAGIYLTHVELTDDPGVGFEEDELALDIFYRFQITPAIYFQPEFQYIADPANSSFSISSPDDAMVAGFRVGIAF